MTTVDCSVSTRVCPKCGEEKPLTVEFWLPTNKKNRASWVFYACRSCYNVMNREPARKYAAEKRSQNREAHNQYMREWRRRNRTPESRQDERRRKAERNGTVYIPLEERRINRTINLRGFNARKNLKEFLANSSDEEVKCWYAATGKPWLNPRLTPAEKDKARHQFDHEYHIKRRLYYRDRKTKRRFSIKATNDGTLSFKIIKQATQCLYCGAAFSTTCKATLDHLIPIKKGGSHSAANVVVCCLTCNSRKGSLDYLDWVNLLVEPYRTRSLRVWRKLRGASPHQCELFG